MSTIDLQLIRRFYSTLLFHMGFGNAFGDYFQVEMAEEEKT